MSQIAYVGADDQIYVAEPDGSAAHSLTQAVTGLSNNRGWTFRWPTYSRDGRRLAFAGYRSVAGALRSGAILVADPAQNTASVAFESPEHAPIYLYWAPDNRHLTVLLQHGRTLELHLLDGAHQEQPRRLLVGQPLYWSWAADGKSLAVHLGDGSASGDPGWVGLLHVDNDGVREERFADSAGAFRAPAWTRRGGKLAYAGLGGGSSILTVRDASGTLTRLGSGSTSVAFTWSPDDSWLAFAFAMPNRPGVYQGLELIRADGSERHRASQDPLVAFFWSPDSQRLALLGVDPSAQALSWSVVNVDGKGRRALASFVPTNDFAFQLPFFDQYAQSTSLWSTDGHKLVYGMEGGGERTNGSAVSEHIVVLDVDGQASPAPIARGSLAVWSPPRER